MLSTRCEEKDAEIARLGKGMRLVVFAAYFSTLNGQVVEQNEVYINQAKQLVPNLHSKLKLAMEELRKSREKNGDAPGDAVRLSCLECKC